MNATQLALLDENGYEVIDEAYFFILKRKLISNSAKLYVFLPLSFLFILIGFSSIDSMDLISVLVLLILGIIFFSIPFWDYLTAPFHSLYLDKKLNTILFRSVHSRAYRLSELTNISLSMSSRYADVNAFSDSNKEYTYLISLHFGPSKEEVFKIVKRDEYSEETIMDLKTNLEKLLA